MTKWKLVPVEPTPEMFVDIQASLMREGSFIGSEILREWYRFMLRAAPQPPRLSDERILEIYEEAKANWNAQADQCNQWSDLGVDEVVTLVARAIEREIFGDGND